MAKETFNEMLERLGIEEKIICPDCGKELTIIQDIVDDELPNYDTGDFELAISMILWYECDCGFTKDAYSTTKGIGILR